MDCTLIVQRKKISTFTDIQTPLGLVIYPQENQRGMHLQIRRRYNLMEIQRLSIVLYQQLKRNASHCAMQHKKLFGYEDSRQA